MSRHGENIWKRKDGRWEARYVKGRDPRGKALYASVYAKTYAEVKKKREAVLQELKSHPSSSLPAKSLGMIVRRRKALHYECSNRFFCPQARTSHNSNISAEPARTVGNLCLYNNRFL